MKLVLEVDLEVEAQHTRERAEAQIMTMARLVLQSVPPKADLRLALKKGTKQRMILGEAAAPGDISKATARLTLEDADFDPTITGEQEGCSGYEIMTSATTLGSKNLDIEVIDRERFDKMPTVEQIKDKHALLNPDASGFLEA